MTKDEGNTQKEKGFTPMQNDILEAIARIHLSDYESRCIHFLWRKTYGWVDEKGKRKQFDTISHSQWAAGTGISRRHIDRVLKSLLNRKIIIRVDKKMGKELVIEWGFQKEHELWVSPKQVTVSKQLSITQLGVALSPEQVMEPSPVEVHTKENKENIQNKISTDNKKDKQCKEGKYKQQFQNP